MGYIVLDIITAIYHTRSVSHDHHRFVFVDKQRDLNRGSGDGARTR